MSAAGLGFVADSFRWGSSYAPWYETLVIGCVIAVMAVACVLISGTCAATIGGPSRW